MSTKNKKQKKKQSWPRPILGVLLERSISHADAVFYNFIGIAQLGIPFIKINHGRTDLVRNKMALHLLNSNFTHLVMLDIDHVHPVDIVHRLMGHVVRNPHIQVIGGLNFRRGIPYDPCAFIKGDDGRHYPMAEWEPGLIRVDALGTGSIAISREVFEKIEPPWFYNDYSRAMDDVWPGEDMGFAKKCEEAGIAQWVDTNLTSPHLIDAVVEENSYRTYIQDNDIASAPVSYVRGERVIGIDDDTG
jgi:hypothetical protein